MILHHVSPPPQDTIGSRYTYKGRISTDNCDIIDLADGEGEGDAVGVVCVEVTKYSEVLFVFALLCHVLPSL